MAASGRNVAKSHARAMRGWGGVEGSGQPANKQASKSYIYIYMYIYIYIYIYMYRMYICISIFGPTWARMGPNWPSGPKVNSKA